MGEHDPEHDTLAGTDHISGSQGKAGSMSGGHNKRGGGRGEHIWAASRLEGKSQGVTEPIWPPPMLTERHHDHGHPCPPGWLHHAIAVGYGCRCHLGFARP